MTSDILAHAPWLGTLLAAVIAALAALVVHHLGGAVLRRATRPALVLHHIVLACQQPAGFALPLMALQLIWQAAPDDLRFMASVRHVNALAMMASLTWLAMNGISGLASGVIARHPSDVADNLQARRIHTQARVLARVAMFTVLLVGVALMLMTFPGARQVGASLLASAGVVGIVAGIAARPVFSNLIAGLQIALAQPIRLDDVLIVKGEWGRVEEITGTYVVLKIWDERRMIIPLQWFIENPFENWTRHNAQLLGTVFLYLDFATPLEPLRAELKRILDTARDWDGRVATVVALETTERALQVRVLVSAASSGQAFDLRCQVREGLLAFLARDYPQCLPQMRVRDAADIAPAPSRVHADAS
jgi:small-conductance mechanosensitive channel